MGLDKNWEIRIRKEAHKSLNRFPKKDSQRIFFAIKQMSANPYYGDIQKMEGEKDVWRRRAGNYRIFYEILNEEKVVYVFDIQRRTSRTY